MFRNILLLFTSMILIFSTGSKEKDNNTFRVSGTYKNADKIPPINPQTMTDFGTPRACRTLGRPDDTA